MPAYLGYDILSQVKDTVTTSELGRIGRQPTKNFDFVIPKSFLIRISTIHLGQQRFVLTR